MRSVMFGHAEDEHLEQCSMGRLQGPELAVLEEHLLACEDCRKRLQESDAYVAAMQRAARSMQSGESVRTPYSLLAESSCNEGS
jgi:hypothetical protein